jgi:hypothetical protein
MADLMECMCLECGVSTYLDLSGVSVEDDVGSGHKFVLNSFCPECGGALLVVGKAGDEPFYRLK